MTRLTRLLRLALVPATVALPAMAAAPERIVSLNLCTDQLLVLLVPADRIAAVTDLAVDPTLSYVAGQAASLPRTSGSAEDILARGPDLVLAGRYGAPAAVSLLKARGVPVVELDLADDFQEIREQVRAVADAVGEAERGEALLRSMNATLRSAEAPPGTDRPQALVWQARGFTAGAGTLPDAVLRAAGYDNFATRSGLAGYGYLPLETVVAGRPDLLIAAGSLPDHPSLADALLQHDALSALPRLEVPAALWACGGPFTAEAVALLAARRDRAEGPP